VDLSVRDAVVVVGVLCVDFVRESYLRSFRRMMRSCSGVPLFLRTMSEDCWEERDRRASSCFCNSGGKKESVLTKHSKLRQYFMSRQSSAVLFGILLWFSTDNVHFLTSLEFAMSPHSSEWKPSQAVAILTWHRPGDHSHPSSRTTSRVARRLYRSTTKQDD